MGISDLQYGLISATSLERQLRPEAISNQLVTFTNDLMKEVDVSVFLNTTVASTRYAAFFSGRSCCGQERCLAVPYADTTSLLPQ